MKHLIKIEYFLHVVIQKLLKGDYYSWQFSNYFGKLVVRIILISVMVDGPAVGKAGDCLDWIAGGLEIKGLRDSGNPCPL